jgi:hypothetical protein
MYASMWSSYDGCGQVLFWNLLAEVLIQVFVD